MDIMLDFCVAVHAVYINYVIIMDLDPDRIFSICTAAVCSHSIGNILIYGNSYIVT